MMVQANTGPKKTSAANQSVLGIGRHPAPSQNHCHRSVFGGGDRGASRPAFCVPRISWNLSNSSLGYVFFRRHSSRLRTSQKSFTSEIRLRSACGDFDRYLGPVREYLSGAIVVLMLSGGEARELRIAQCIFRVTRFGEAHARHRASETRLRCQRCGAR